MAAQPHHIQTKLNNQASTIEATMESPQGFPVLAHEVAEQEKIPSAKEQDELIIHATDATAMKRNQESSALLPVFEFDGEIKGALKIEYIPIINVAELSTTEEVQNLDVPLLEFPREALRQLGMVKTYDPGNSSGIGCTSSPTAGTSQYSPSTHANSDMSDEDDTYVYDTAEWLTLAAWVERMRAEIINKTADPNAYTQGRGPEYIYRVYYDGANDYSFGVKFAKNTFPLKKSIVSHNSEKGGEWSRSDLLNHSDRIRYILSCHHISDQDISPTSLILSKLLSDEEDPSRMIPLKTIAYARLDKLLATMIKEGQEIAGTIAYDKACVTAVSLETRWKERFGSSYDQIDELRLNHLKSCGAFHDVAVNRYSNDPRSMFIVKRCKPTGTYIEMDNRYRPGDWWLNLACAYRDGITGSATEILTDCRYGVLTLALLDGDEVAGEDNRTSRYSVTGNFDCIPLELIKLNFGKPLRLLRGSGLSSIWAPEGGIRYDGLYTLKTFGTQYHGDDVWTWNLTLQQLGREPDLVSLLPIPTPSQLDDWNLCKAMVEATLEEAQEDVGKIKALRARASTPEWDDRLSYLSRRLSNLSLDLTRVQSE